MEDLVGVDVADAGHHVLVEQQRLDLATPTQHDAAQLGPAETVGDRVDPEPHQFGHLRAEVHRVEHHHLAERARVDEVHLE